jgi:glyoxylase-like metal-dependent hydrolase (beta-lactamase superfamily II)
LLTHHHFDHVLGAGGFVDAEVYAAPAVARTLREGLPELCLQAKEYGANGAEVDRAAAAVRLPDHLVLRTDVTLGGRSVHVQHVGPAHTDHDLVAVITPAVPGDRTVVFCGDLIEESADPAVDAESDVAAWPAALGRLLLLGGPDAVYVPGHGATVDAAFVHRQRDWLAAQL